MVGVIDGKTITELVHERHTTIYLKTNRYQLVFSPFGNRAQPGDQFLFNLGRPINGL